METEIQVNGRVLRLVEGDITLLDVDAIVNAANQHLQLGAGVAGSIRSRGGPAIQRECDAIGFCPVGDAAITGGGNLKARHVIHAVGPFGSDPRADEMLVSATKASLRVAGEHGLASVAFPAISTGVFGFPMGRCAELMLTTARDVLTNAPSSVKLVVFCLYGQAAYDLFASELARLG